MRTRFALLFHDKHHQLEMEQAAMKDLLNKAVRSFQSHSGDSKQNFR